ncbi:hypothetical protein OHB12_06120 [Nocardia sp. NBC_01730]|uniref:AAA family ATPase n=1 Tax=Nocardia sp. NBC_01730 TaxID=2975998 RepID=UPI002E152E9A|nr:hypothetical protein OHB12_06120 [Nocardia sp. NBC_01730]
MDEQHSVFLPAMVRERLDQAAVPIRSAGAMVLCGFPASGKSSAARWLAARMGAVVLDKDKLAPVLEESVMTRLTGAIAIPKPIARSLRQTSTTV